MVFYVLRKNINSKIFNSIKDYKSAFKKFKSIKELEKEYKTFYAVKKGFVPGVYVNYDDCIKQITDFYNYDFKKFKYYNEALKYVKKQNIINVYTDGSCINNGKKNSSSGIGIYFKENDKRNVSEYIKGNYTNNHMELLAIYRSLNILEKEIKNNIKINIYTDSEYSIKCGTTYGEKNCKNNWTNNISNKDLIKKIYNIVSNNSNIELKYIKAHTNKKDIHSIGNSEADKLAKKASKNKI